MSNFCYLNGKILPFDKAFLNLDDLGMLRGYGAFEVLKTVNGKIFLFNEHFNRLVKSSEYLGIKPPLKKSEIEEVIKKLIFKNKIKQAAIRIVLTGGRSADFISFNSNLPTFYILVSEYEPLRGRLYEKGVRVISLDFARQNHLFKTTNYLNAVKIVHERQKKEKFFEILYTNNGNVLECSTSNFFMFFGDKLITPQDGILHGVTKNLIVELTKNACTVLEKPIKLENLNPASECFITATNKDILPVVKIDDKIIGNGKPGENTKKLMKILREFMEKY